MENIIITIGRQHGSGGRTIGELLAKKMGITYYDKELISLTAKKTGFAQDFVREVEEKQTSSFLYSIYTATQVPTVYDQARAAQFEVIREIASKGSCVIVGRAADCVLRDDPRCVRVFIHAPLAERIRRATEAYHAVYDNPERALIKKDRSRAAFEFVDAFERGAVEGAGGDEDVDEAGLFERGVECERSGLAGDEAS